MSVGSEEIFNHVVLPELYLRLRASGCAPVQPKDRMQKSIVLSARLRMALDLHHVVKSLSPVELECQVQITSSCNCLVDQIQRQFAIVRSMSTVVCVKLVASSWIQYNKVSQKIELSADQTKQMQMLARGLCGLRSHAIWYPRPESRVSIDSLA